jgi:hypothetical protein
MDVSNAFFHNYLTEEVFMEQFAGCVDKKHLEDVYKLNKCSVWP